MARETTNTSKFQLLPEGEGYQMTVVGVPEKRRSKSGKCTFRVWKFKTSLNGTERTINKIFFAWDSKDLLLAVGGQEISQDQIEWDDEQVAGRTFICDIRHEEDEQGNMREVFENIQQTAWDEVAPQQRQSVQEVTF